MRHNNLSPLRGYPVLPNITGAHAPAYTLPPLQGYLSRQPTTGAHAPAYALPPLQGLTLFAEDVQYKRRLRLGGRNEEIEQAMRE